jgi:uncharacterized coiled-coil protein SlyX
MLTKEERMQDIKARIKFNEDMYDRLKDIVSKDDKVMIAIKQNIAWLKEKLEKLEKE